MACWAKYETKFSMKRVVPCWSLSATYSAKTGNAERWDKAFSRHLACLVTLSWELCVGFDRLCHHNLLHAVIGYKKQTFSLAMFLIQFFNFEKSANLACFVARSIFAVLLFNSFVCWFSLYIRWILDGVNLYQLPFALEDTALIGIWKRLEVTQESPRAGLCRITRAIYN